MNLAVLVVHSCPLRTTTSCGRCHRRPHRTLARLLSSYSVWPGHSSGDNLQISSSNFFSACRSPPMNARAHSQAQGLQTGCTHRVCKQHMHRFNAQQTTIPKGVSMNYNEIQADTIFESPCSTTNLTHLLAGI